MKIQFILDEIKDQYLIDERPWIIGFSGGKDSSMVLQLVWYALRQIPKEKLTKSIHVLNLTKWQSHKDKKIGPSVFDHFSTQF